MPKRKLDNKIKTYGEYVLPLVFQLSIIVSLPLLVFKIGPYAILSVLLAPVYHWLAIVAAGHMVISHNRNAGKIMNWVLHVLFFFTTFITPGAWAAYHIQHHKHTDSPLDPQSPKHHGLKVLSITGWDHRLKDLRTYITHKQKPMSNFFHVNYGFLVCLPLIFFLLVPYEAVLFAWAVPASLGLSLGTWSAYYTHRDGEPVEKFSFINKILLLGESENHKHHHDHWHTNSKLVNIFYD